MQREMNLLDVQRRFMAALREPILAESRDRTELQPRPGTVSPAFVAAAEDLIVPSPTLQPVERLELYHRQYWYRLLDSIAEDFPGLRLLLGEEAFWHLIEAYLEAIPSMSFTLRHLGQSLAGFIAEHPDLAPHPEYAQDVARLEYAVIEAFEAAEHAPIHPSDLDRTPIALQPYVRMLALRTAADEIWRRAGEGQPIGGLDPASDRPVRFIAVFRQEFEIKVEHIPPAAHAILSAIKETSSLDDAMERVTGDESLACEIDSARVSQWFNTWVSRGWLTARREDSPRDERGWRTK